MKHDTTYDPAALIAERLEHQKALAESHAELVGVLGVLVDTSEADDHMAHRYGVGVGVIKVARETLTKARCL